jgi:aspartate-semialdehyde dehydrogenase
MGRARRLLQCLGVSHGTRRAAAHPRSQPRSHGPDQSAAAEPRLERIHRDESQLHVHGFHHRLPALADSFGIKKAFVVSLQALSGAGYPGVASLDAVDNVVPYIGGEEPKVETEPCKMLGKLNATHVIDAPIKISAHTNRVAVTDGHTVCVSLEFDQPIGPQERAGHARLRMGRDRPIAAVVRARVIEVRSNPTSQPRRDRDAGGA